MEESGRIKQDRGILRILYYFLKIFLYQLMGIAICPKLYILL